MKKFVLILRGAMPDAPPDQEKMQREMMAWQKWYQTLKEQGSLADAGNPLGPEGRLVTTDSIQSGMGVSDNQVIFHIMTVQATDIEAAADIARRCPSIGNSDFSGTSSMEVREIFDNPAS